MRKRLDLNFLLSLLLFFYSLFAFSSVKALGSPYVDDFATNNLVIIIPIVLIIKMFLIKKRKISRKVFLIYVLYLVSLLLNIFINYNSQSLYSFLVITLPMLLILEVNEGEGKKLDKFNKIVVITSMAYSVLVISEFFFYDFFVSLAGLKAVPEYLTRHSTMLGTSITTSYFLLMCIPINFNCRHMSKKWRKISVLSIILCVFAVILEQSRISFIVLGVYVILYFLLFGKKAKTRYKVAVIIFTIASLIFVFNNPKLSRLYQNYSESLSTQMRLETIDSGVSEFLRAPVLGSGVAKFYKRTWDANSRIISIQGNTSMTDPHNLYVYTLVEQGVIGAVLYILAFVVIIKEYIRYLPENIKNNTYIMLIGLSICSLGGSQLMNEISFSLIFWLFLMFLCSGGYYERTKQVQS